uniref:Deacetylase sirtuin-type domain-containing protein n=1 Tax=Ditylum brightwellii TaxID=49249 RepID=A0A7S4S7Y0_9STRA
MTAESEDNFKKQCKKAADALAEADVLLVVTGAGFSADSGLAVYGDVAKVKAYQERNLEYRDVCQPKWVETDPELFYGFWGQCFNDYRKTKPHKGYDIIARWRDDKKMAGGGKVDNDIRSCLKEKMDVVDGPAGAFHVFTSNADAHFYDYFKAHEIHDCHGNIELWQCSSRTCESGIWRAPVQHDFFVDTHTMLAPQRKETDLPKEYSSSRSIIDKEITPCIGQIKGNGKRDNLLCNMPPSKDRMGWHQDEGTNWPKCGHCGSLARPAIFMFGDFGWKYDEPQSKRWDLWVETVLDLCEDLSVCIMEIGCGLNVQTCRTTSEQLVEFLVKRGGSVDLVRINPDFASAPEYSVTEDHIISIPSKGLRAIEKIDEMYCSRNINEKDQLRS